MRTDHFPPDPDSLGPYVLEPYVDPDAPTIPELPAYQGYWPEPPMPEQPVSLFERVLDWFSRLSVGARIVCIGCAALVAFCLVSPYVDVAENTLSQAINYGTSAAPAGSTAHPSSSARTKKPHSSTTNVSTTNVPTQRGGALAWSTSTAAPSLRWYPNPHANSHAKLHAHTHWAPTQPPTITVMGTDITADSGVGELCITFTRKKPCPRHHLAATSTEA